MKKTIALLLVIVLAATAIVGGTLAFFTDTDAAENDFVMGGGTYTKPGETKPYVKVVDIVLVEDFVQDSGFLPGVAVNKDVTIKSEENAVACWVWYEYLVPAVLDAKDAKVLTVANDTTGKWNYNATIDGLVTDGFIGTVEMGGMQYNKYLALYTEALEPGTATTKGMDSVTMNSAVDYDKVNEVFTLAGAAIDYDFAQGVTILVNAYGIQKQGLEDVVSAYTTYNTPASN